MDKVYCSQCKFCERKSLFTDSNAAKLNPINKSIIPDDPKCMTLPDAKHIPGDAIYPPKGEIISYYLCKARNIDNHCPYYVAMSVFRSIYDKE